MTALAVSTAILLSAPEARAQVNQHINPNFRISPWLTLQQAAFNTATIGRAYAQVPPYALGYNPYPSPIISPYGNAAPAYNPYLGTGALANNYMSTYPG